MRVVDSAEMITIHIVACINKGGAVILKHKNKEARGIYMHCSARDFSRGGCNETPIYF